MSVPSRPPLVISSKESNQTILDSTSPSTGLVISSPTDNLLNPLSGVSSSTLRQPPPQPPSQSAKKLRKPTPIGSVGLNFKTEQTDNSASSTSNNNSSVNNSSSSSTTDNTASNTDQGNKFLKNLWNLVKDSSMFFRLGFQSRSASESLLEREDCSLEELLDEDDILQEAKAHNAKLVEFLKKTEILTKLIEYITIEVRFDPEQLNKPIEKKNNHGDERMNENQESDDENAIYIDEEKLAKRSRKYPLLAAEILCADIEDLYSVIVSDKILMSSLLAFIIPSLSQRDQNKKNSSILDHQLAGYWVRVMTCLLQRKNTDVQKYIMKEGDDLLVQSFIDCLEIVGIDEILLKLMGCENSYDSSPDNQSAIQMRTWLQPSKGNEDNQKNTSKDEDIRQNQKIIAEWWLKYGVVDKIVEKYVPGQDIDLLSNVTRILCEIVRRSSPQSQSDLSKINPIAASLLSHDVVSKLMRTVLEDSILLREALPFVTILLDTGVDVLERNQNDENKQTLPDPMNVIVSHLPDLVSLLLNPPPMDRCITTFGVLDPPLGETRLRVIEFMATLFHLSIQCSPIEVALADSKAPQALCELFFKYEFNNLLHNLFFRVFSYAISLDKLSVENKDSDTEHGEASKNGSRLLRKAFIIDCGLLDKIIEAERLNDIAQSQPKGMRKGYMGHLTQIANAIVQIASNDKTIGNYTQTHAAWQEYIRGPLDARNVKEATQIGAPLSNSSSGRSSPFMGEQHKLPQLDQKQQEEFDKEFEMFDDEVEFDSSSSDDDEEINMLVQTAPQVISEQSHPNTMTDDNIVRQETQTNQDTND